MDNYANHYILCLVGGAPNKRIYKSIRKKLKWIGNVEVYISGCFYPIPRNLLQTFDVSVATAGGANITAVYENIPTISIDIRTASPNWNIKLYD